MVDVTSYLLHLVSLAVSKLGIKTATAEQLTVEDKIDITGADTVGFPQDTNSVGGDFSDAFFDQSVTLTSGADPAAEVAMPDRCIWFYGVDITTSSGEAEVKPGPRQRSDQSVAVIDWVTDPGTDETAQLTIQMAGTVP